MFEFIKHKFQDLAFSFKVLAATTREDYTRAAIRQSVCAEYGSGAEIYNKLKNENSSDCVALAVRVFTARTLEENARALQPVFSLAVEGNEAMRQTYRQERIIQSESAPLWAQQACYLIAKEEYARAVPRSAKSVNSRGNSTRQSIPSEITGAEYEKLWLPLFSTAHLGASFLAEAKSDHYSGKIRPGEIFSVCFSPTDCSLRGNAARESLHRCINLLLAVRITEDFFRMLEVSVPQEIIRNISLSNAANPWAVRANETVNRMLYVSDLLAARDTPVTRERRTELLLRCLTKHPNLFRTDLIDDASSEPLVQASPVIGKQSSIRSVEETAGSTLRNAVVDALQGAISKRRTPETRALARELFKGIKRGLLDYDEVVLGLARGRSGQEILGDIAAPALRSPSPAISPTVPPPKVDIARSVPTGTQSRDEIELRREVSRVLYEGVPTFKEFFAILRKHFDVELTNHGKGGHKGLERNGLYVTVTQTFMDRTEPLSHQIALDTLEALKVDLRDFVGHAKSK